MLANDFIIQPNYVLRTLFILRGLRIRIKHTMAYNGTYCYQYVHTLSCQYVAKIDFLRLKMQEITRNSVNMQIALRKQDKLQQSLKGGM